MVNWEVLILQGFKFVKHKKKYVCQLAKSVLSMLLSLIRLKFTNKLISKNLKTYVAPLELELCISF